MDKEKFKLDELGTSENFEDVRKNDIAWSCIEDIMKSESIPKYDVFQYTDEYSLSYIYQESKNYNPFASKGYV